VLFFTIGTTGYNPLDVTVVNALLDVLARFSHLRVLRLAGCTSSIPIPSLPPVHPHPVRQPLVTGLCCSPLFVSLLACWEIIFDGEELYFSTVGLMMI
jgi:hypothetical protein